MRLNLDMDCRGQARVRQPFIPILVTVALSLALPGCGGGGGGTSAGPTATVSQNPPPIPEPVYNGYTSGATVTPLTAGGLSAYVFESVQVADSIAGDIIPTDLIKGFPGGSGLGVVSGTENGPNGGTMDYAGKVNGTEYGWITETYKNYSYIPTGATQTATVNGEVIIEVNGNQATVGFSNYQFVGLGVNITYTGSFDRTVVASKVASGPQTANTTFNLSIEDNLHKVDNELTNFDLTTISIPDSTDTPITRTFSGKAYNSQLGYVNVDTTGPIEYANDPSMVLPMGGAYMQIKSLFSDTLNVGALNSYFFTIGLSRGTAAPSSWARFKWSDFNIDTTAGTANGSPVAVAEIDTYPGTGFPVTLDARYSHSPKGNFLTFQWKLLRAPIGSSATIVNASSDEATITPDIVGDYLVQLTASDGSQTGTDTIVVSIPTQNAATVPEPMMDYTAGPDQTANIGDTVTLDARASSAFNSLNANPYAGWSLTVPSGSNAVLSDSNSLTPTFVPDIPGYYYATLSSVTGTYSMVVTVDEPLAFYPPVAFDDTLGTATSAFKVTDLNNDGQPDLVVGNAPNVSFGGLDQIRVYLQNSGNGFNAPISLPGTDEDSFAVQDLNQDGLPDIVAAGSGSANTFLQAVDGSFSLSQSASYPASSSTKNEPIQIGKLFGSASLSVAALAYNGSLYEFPIDNSGVLQTPTSTSVNPISPSYLQIADLNDDGLADLVFNNTTFGPSIFTAQAGGTFTAFSAANALTAAAGDLYGDGKNELVYAGSNFLTIEPETLSGSAVTINNTIGAPEAIAFSDINGSGRTDIALLHASGLGFLFQQPDTSFSPEVFYPITPSPAAPFWIGDINGDGIPDLIYYAGDRLFVQYGYKP